MALIVQKFGGTSVGTSERIKNVAQRVAKFRTLGHQVVVVVSAISGETNKLLALAKELQAEPDPRELDVVLATGEQVTIGLLCMALLDPHPADYGFDVKSDIQTLVGLPTGVACAKDSVAEKMAIEANSTSASPYVEDIFLSSSSVADFVDERKIST